MARLAYVVHVFTAFATANLALYSCGKSIAEKEAIVKLIVFKLDTNHAWCNLVMLLSNRPK